MDEPIITHVLPEENKIVVVYRMNIPDELVAPEMSVRIKEDTEPELWVVTKRERVFDNTEIPDGYYVTYEPPKLGGREEEEEEVGELNLRLYALIPREEA